MITPIQQIVWSIVSRRPIADLSPTSRQPIATHFQSVGNQSPTSRRPVAHQSPNAILIAQRLHWLQLFFSRKAVADRLQYMCDRGFMLDKAMLDNPLYTPPAPP